MLIALALDTALTSQAEPEPMAAFLNHVREKYGLPSICAGAIVNGQIVSLDAVGVRHLGSDENVTTDDSYHCGSITKQFTAALFASYAQQGRIGWDEPLPRLFPNFGRAIDPGFAKVTPRHLMAHRSGLAGISWPKDPPAEMLRWKGEPPSPREEYARLILTTPPDHPAEVQKVYANANYVLLGAALESRIGNTWEQLLTSRILRPLRLKTAGFGPVGMVGAPKGPWGHVVKDGTLTPVPPDPWGDNPEAMGPSATLHMSVPDLLKWCAFQADEGANGGILTPESFKILHTPAFGGDYAGGLIATPRDWGGGLCFNHAGSNTMNYENLWIAPRKHFALVVATNAVTPEVGEAVERVTEELIKRYCPK